MALKSLFDSNRRREIQNALKRGGLPFVKPRKSGFDEEYIEVDERDLILIEPSSAAASPGRAATPNAPASGALIAPAGLQPAPVLAPPPLPARSVAKLPYLKQRALDEELINAFEKVELQRMEAALDSGANVDAMDRLGRTCLMRAAQTNDLRTMIFLIKKNASLDAKDNEGKTALAYAAGRPPTEACELLIARGAEVDARDNHGRTPLMHAAMGGHEENASLLMTRGADVFAKDENHANPQWHADNTKHRPLAEYLRMCMEAAQGART